jgi:hypothetical protein
MKPLMAIIIVAIVLQLGFAANVGAQTPSPTAAPIQSPSPTATPSPSPSPSASGTAIPPQRTSIPGHPLQLRFGPGSANETSYGFPNVDGLLLITDALSLRRLAPQAAPLSLQGYELVDASGQVGRGVFSTRFRFRVPGQRLLTISAWTKTGDWVMTVVANSPVTDAQQTTIGGLAALTLLPTPAVLSDYAPRDIWMTDGATIWHLDFAFGYTSNAEALALAEEVAKAVQSPAPPDTGSGATSMQSGFERTALVGAALAILAAAVATSCSYCRRCRESRTCRRR